MMRPETVYKTMVFCETMLEVESVDKRLLNPQ